jgi:hypothetical protein
MYRVIKLMICRDGEIRDISGLAWRFAVSTTRRLHGLEHHPDVQEAQRVLVALMLRDVGPWTGIEFAGSRDAGDWCYFRWRYKSFKGFSHFLTHSHDFEKRINYRC